MCIDTITTLLTVSLNSYNVMRYINKTNIPYLFVSPCLLAEQQLANSKIVYKCMSTHLNANANVSLDSNANANANAIFQERMQMFWDRIQMQMQMFGYKYLGLAFLMFTAPMSCHPNPLQQRKHNTRESFVCIV